MRAALLLISLAGYASAAILWTRQSTPPPCTDLCLNTNTNNISTGSCSASDIACLCALQPYVQAVINCMAIECSNIADVSLGIQYSSSYCAADGVNTGPSVTTPTAQLSPTSTPSGGGSHPTSAPASSSTTTTHSGAERVNMVTASILVGALAFVAVAMGL